MAQKISYIENFSKACAHVVAFCSTERLEYACKWNDANDMVFRGAGISITLMKTIKANQTKDYLAMYCMEDEDGATIPLNSFEDFCWVFKSYALKLQSKSASAVVMVQLAGGRWEITLIGKGHLPADLDDVVLNSAHKLVDACNKHRLYVTNPYALEPRFADQLRHRA